MVIFQSFFTFCGEVTKVEGHWKPQKSRKRLKSSKITSESNVLRFLDTTPDPDVCTTAFDERFDGFVQCNVAEDATRDLVGYTRDNAQRHEWTISGTQLSLKTYDNDLEQFIGLSDALLAWYNSLSCTGEIAYEDDTCPERPRLRLDTGVDTCVGGYQDRAHT